MGKNSDRVEKEDNKMEKEDNKMERERADKITLREAFQAHCRVARKVWECCPGIFLSTGLYSGVSALSPYVAIYLSARIINELAGARRPAALKSLVAAALASAAALTLLTGLLLRLKEYMNSKCEMRLENMYADKMLSMDFADVESTRSHDLLSQVSGQATVS